MIHLPKTGLWFTLLALFYFYFYKVSTDIWCMFRKYQVITVITAFTKLSQKDRASEVALIYTNIHRRSPNIWYAIKRTSSVQKQSKLGTHLSYVIPQDIFFGKLQKILPSKLIFHKLWLWKKSHTFTKFRYMINRTFSVQNQMKPGTHLPYAISKDCFLEYSKNYENFTPKTRFFWKFWLWKKFTYAHSSLNTQCSIVPVFSLKWILIHIFLMPFTRTIFWKILENSWIHPQIFL